MPPKVNAQVQQLAGTVSMLWKYGQVLIVAVPIMWGAFQIYQQWLKVVDAAEARDSRVARFETRMQHLQDTVDKILLIELQKVRK